jgi:iron complex outermembrane receptor protein
VGGTPYDLGTVNITRTPSYGGEPVLSDDGRRVQDEVDQLTASAGWGVNVGETLELRFGAHRTRYEKRVTPIGGVESARAEALWLYNASGVWSLSPRTALFASWVTGLEETGTAPQSAVNRNEILPPVEAEQMEFGVRHALTDRLSFISAAFDVSKPTPGFRSDGTYGLVGEVRHRGIEASLAGQVREGTSVVLGAVLTDATVSGPLVEAGAVGERAPGVPGANGVASIDHRLSFAPNWSVDAVVNHSGGRQANTLNTLSTPSHTFLNVGGRYRFRAGPTDAMLRLQVLNVFDRRGWVGASSGLLSPTVPRRWQAALTFRSR